MHGPTCFPRCALGPRRITRTAGAGAARSGPTRRAASIKDGPSTLNHAAWWLRGSRGRSHRLCYRRWRRRLVYRARTGLGHNHAARNRGRRRNRSSDLGRGSGGAKGNWRRRFCRSRNHRSACRLRGYGRRGGRPWGRRSRCYRTRNRRETHIRAWDGARDRGPGHTWRRCRWASFHTRERGPGNDRPSGWFGRDRRCGRWGRHHDPRLLPWLGNDPSWCRGGRCWNTLDWTSKVWADLPGRSLLGSTRARRNGRGRNGRTGWWRSGYLSGYLRHSRHTRHRRWGNSVGGWPGYLGRSRRSNRRPLDHCRGFISSLLNCFEHVAGLRYARPIDLLLRLAVGLRRTSTILAAAALKVLAHTFCFIAFQRARVGLFFGHTDVRQGVKDRPAFDFQLAC